MTRTILTRAVAAFAIASAMLTSAACATDQSAASVAADTPATHELTVMVAGLKPGEGQLFVGVYGGQQAYDTWQAVDGKAVDVTGDKAMVSFTLPEGEYGLKLFQDLSGDQRPNFGPNGAPTEPVAFSNNASIDYGPAGWGAASFELSADSTQKLMMIGH